METLAEAARLPGSKMIPPAHALRACLALKLWSLERKSHVMSLVADEGLALFSGLNVSPKRTFHSEYSCRVTPRQTQKLLAAWHDQARGAELWDGSSFNLDFHSVPYYGDHPLVESHYVSMRSRSQPSILAFLAQDEQSQSFCYSNADLRQGEQADEIFAFIDFWKRPTASAPSIWFLIPSSRPTPTWGDWIGCTSALSPCAVVSPTRVPTSTTMRP